MKLLLHPRTHRVRRPGTLLYFFGIDGSGKTSHADKLAAALESDGLEVRRASIKSHHLLAYPFYLALSKDSPSGLHHTLPFRNPILKRLWAWFELGNVSLAAIIRVLFPMKRGRIVVCDRYALDSLVSLAHGLSQPEVLSGVPARIARHLIPANSVLIHMKAAAEVASSRKRDEGLDLATAAAYATAYERLVHYLELLPQEIDTGSQSFETTYGMIRDLTSRALTGHASGPLGRRRPLRVAVIGPVGVGKTTVIGMVRSRLRVHGLTAAALSGVFNNDLSRLLLLVLTGGAHDSSALNRLLATDSPSKMAALRFWILVDALTSKFLFFLKTASLTSDPDVVLVEDSWAGALATYEYATPRQPESRLISRMIRHLERTILDFDLLVCLEARDGVLRERWNCRGSPAELPTYLDCQRRVVRQLAESHPASLVINTEWGTAESEADIVANAVLAKLQLSQQSRPTEC